MTTLKVARRNPPLSGSPDTDDSRKTLSRNTFITSKFIFLKIQTLYQVNMTMLEVARGDSQLSDSPDTDDSRKNFELVYLSNR